MDLVERPYHLGAQGNPINRYLIAVLAVSLLLAIGLMLYVIYQAIEGCDK